MKKSGRFNSSALFSYVYIFHQMAFAYIVIPKQNSSLLPLQLYCSYELHFEDIF